MRGPRRGQPTGTPGRPALARLLYVFALPVILAWLGAIATLNLAVPQLETVIKDHARSFLPDDAASVQAIAKMGDHFGGVGTNNFVYLLLEGEQQLGSDAQGYYSALLAEINADTEHVNSSLDLWSDPKFAPANESADGRAAYALINLAGNMGTALAMKSTQAVRDIIAATPAPAGITAHLTGPSAIVNDELVAVADSILLLLIACGGLVGAILLWVYRSPITVAMPMLVAGAGLGVGRPLVALLGGHQVIGVSIFAAALMAVIVLGAGIDYGIFLLGRYQEARRTGEDPTSAYYTALRGTAHIITASGLTIAGATACMTFTRLAIFSTAGLPCTIAVVVTLAAALTLGPATLALGSRYGLFEPRKSGTDRTLRRWRRIATCVVRWPGPVLVGSLAVLSLALLVLPTFHPSYNERIAQPADSPANLGFAAADRHLPPNIMSPSVFLVEADHDMRNPADLLALAKLTNAVLALPGISNVQGITRPLGAPLHQGTLPAQAGYIGQRMTQLSDVLGHRAGDLLALSDQTARLEATVLGIEHALASGQTGADRIENSATELRTALGDVVAKLDSLRATAQPAKEFIDSIPDCPDNAYCRAALTGFALFDDVHRFDRLVAEVTDGTHTMARTLPGLAGQVSGLKQFIAEVDSVITPVRDTLAMVAPQLTEITEFTAELRDSFAAGDPTAGFFLPSQAFDNPLFQAALPYFFSDDGTMTRMIVTPEMEGFSREAMDVAAGIIPTALQTIKNTALAGSTVTLGGPGGTLLNIEAFAHEDFTTSAVAAFAFVFCVILLLLRSLVAALAVIGTVGLSYLSALGLTAFVWQDLIGNPLHWSVAPVSFVFLVAVGADYNMLLVARFKEELPAGINTGIIRAMVGTGGVVTTAGLVFGFTMFAMLAGYAHNIAQIGTTVGLGLLLDTLIVRSLVIPAIAVLAGRWFWWPMVVRERPARAAVRRPAAESTPVLAT